MTELRAPAAVATGDIGLVLALGAAIVLGGGLTAGARLGAILLLVAVAVVQAVLAMSWVVGTAVPGNRGALVVAAMAAAGSDVAVSLFPHGRLGAMLIVLGLAVPVMFVQQLWRGAARVQVVGSLSGVAVVVFGVVAIAALIQVRHEFTATSLTSPATTGATVAAAAAAMPAAGLVVAQLVDMVLPVPRFDRRIRRGLPALVGAGVAGAAVGYLLLRSVQGFGAAPGIFAGAALGVLVALLSVAAAFVQFTTPVRGTIRRRARAVIAAALPLCLLAPVSFLLLLAIRR